MPYNFEERYNEIREQLIKQGYANKHITYSEFLAIYEPYKEEMSEKEFIQVLGISNGNLKNMKNHGTRAIVLKEGISNEEKEKLKQQIVSDLIQKGYRNKKIDYKEFLILYEPYRGKLKESEFANFLGLSYGNWQNIKNTGKKAIILKKKITDIEEKLKQFIVSDLTKKGYADKSINYDVFLQLYEPYRKELSEKEFASILGISYASWKNIKFLDRKAIILKTEISAEELEKLKQLIVSDLIKKGYANKIIDYKEFLRLYEPYKGKLRESKFANIIGLSDSSWQHIKNEGKKAIILKRKPKEFAEIEKFIVSDLSRKGYICRKIDYKEFLRLYEPYRGKLKESEFANIIGISYGNFKNIKYHGTKAIILKTEISAEELEKLKQLIVSDLAKKGYANKSIDYHEFLILYEPYKSKLKESKFATIIGISYASWQNIKFDGAKAIILKKEILDDEKKNLEELKKLIVSDLIQKCYRNKSIDYKEFLRLYEPYKGKLKESDFANTLGISYGNWQSMRNKGTKARVLKNEITEEENGRLKQSIVSDLMKNGYANKSINYDVFLQLYEPYRKKLSEKEFANTLGITYESLQKIKNNTQKAFINFEYSYTLRLLHLFKESKDYDLAYFEKVSKNLELPISKIVEILTEEKTNLEELLNTLHKRGKIFIGKTKISEKFLQKYGKVISDIMHRYSKSIGRKLHTSFYSEDFAQEAILWVIENKGYIERNFEEDLALQRIISYAKVNCKYMHYRVFSQKKVVSLDESISEDGKLTRYTRIKAKENVQDEVEKREEEIEISEGDTPITAIQQCLLNGMNREESLAFVMKKFVISQEELLQVLTEELSKRNSIKVAQNGEIYLGGRDIDD